MGNIGPEVYATDAGRVCRRSTNGSEQGRNLMIRTMCVALLGAVCLMTVLAVEDASAQQAYGYSWGRTYNTRDWERFYHYPYVYYPQNFWGNEYYRSSEDLYYRYPPEMRIPVYNTQWHNYYPAGRSFENGRAFQRQTGLRYHSGHHFNLDVF